MGGLGENSQAAGGETHHNFESGDDQCRDHRIAGHRTLFRTHRCGAEDGLVRHVGIIAFPQQYANSLDIGNAAP